MSTNKSTLSGIEQQKSDRNFDKAIARRALVNPVGLSAETFYHQHPWLAIALRLLSTGLAALAFRRVTIAGTKAYPNVGKRVEPTREKSDQTGRAEVFLDRSLEHPKRGLKNSLHALSSRHFFASETVYADGVFATIGLALVLIFSSRELDQQRRG